MKKHTKEELEILLKQIENEMTSIQTAESKAILLQTKADILIALVMMERQ